MNRAIIFAAVGIAAAAPQYAAEVRTLTLTEAVHLAISQNRALKIARLKVAENEHKKAGERASYFPTLRNGIEHHARNRLAEYKHPSRCVWKRQEAPNVPSLRNTILPQGRTTFYTSGTQLSQPLARN